MQETEASTKPRIKTKETIETNVVKCENCIQKRKEEYT